MWLYDRVEEKSGFLSIERLFESLESLESSETWSRSYADELTSARATATISSGSELSSRNGMRCRGILLGSHLLCSTDLYVDRIATGGLNPLQIVRSSIFIEEDF